MKRKATIASCLIIAALAGIIVWQRWTVSSFEERLREAEGNVAKRSRTVVPVRVQPPPLRGESAPEKEAKSSSRTEKDATPKERIPSLIQKVPVAAPEAEAENKQQPLTPERRKALIEGRESFNPGPIEESPTPVTEQTVLSKGQSLQINYASTWYAGEVVGFEKDGGVHVRYFGWESSWDEIVPRSDLRLDPKARERAVERYATPAAGAAGGF